VVIILVMNNFCLFTVQFNSTVVSLFISSHQSLTYNWIIELVNLVGISGSVLVYAFLSRW